MIYFDTCYILKCYLKEHGSSEVREVWRAASKCVSCEIARAEFVAGVHRHLREARITRATYLATIQEWTVDQDLELWDWVPLKVELFEEIERLFALLPATTYLRASDALHLASVRMLGLNEIYTSDRHLMKAASHFGITPRNVVPLQQG